MTVTELQWLVGTALTAVIAIAGITLGAFRSMATRLERLADAMKAENDRLHERVNRVRDEYVPRRELNDHMSRLDKTLDEIKESQGKVLDLLTGPRARPP